MIINELLNEEKWDHYSCEIKKMNKYNISRFKKEELYNFMYCMWYTQDEWGRFAPSLESLIGKVNSLLRVAFKIARENYYYDDEYKFFCGYMISQFPEFFEEDFKDYFDAKEYGDRLLQEAKLNKFCLAVMLDNNIVSQNEFKTAKEYLEINFSKEWCIYDYFYTLLSSANIETEKKG
ncbi:MAG: hypothetical protein N4A68_04450 [Maledivibacter sp.]|jgi:hypothetical protein|nr:hypothetical protein [Maledivibacter sp.]